MERDETGHLPVLLPESVAALAIQPSGVYLDCTFGRGGHSKAILAQLGPAGRLIALDRDPQAVAAARRLQEGVGNERFRIGHARFSQLGAALDSCSVGSVDGVLFDLGVSSPQLDDPSRGFSFRADGPLDMRMDPTVGMSARQWLLVASEDEIAAVVRTYGEERFAVPIAKALVARRRDAGDAALASTAELANLVAGVVRRRQKKPEVGKDPATRTFQALRIFINQELEELEIGLESAVQRLKPAGRLAVISFHSLEDRIVKQFIARESGRTAPRDPIRGTLAAGVRVRLRGLGRVLPSKAEQGRNPRARSAVLRVAERLEQTGSVGGAAR
ncbi:MAG: 16S rRNA (cytosine(1402)-N(4))-methyltransferase RsmH [Quisquiliibacterium sp.]